MPEPEPAPRASTGHQTRRFTDAGPQPPTVIERLLRDPKVVGAGGFILFLIVLALWRRWSRRWIRWRRT